MGEGLWSGWGVRTMSEDDAAYSPLSYHNGTVWPHDNSLIALGPRAVRALARGAADRPAHARGVASLRLPAARGLRGAAPLRDAVPDRLPDGRAAAGVGGGHAGPAAAGAARPAAEPGSGTGSSRSLRRELPHWTGSIRLSGVRAFETTWDVRVRGRKGGGECRMRIAVHRAVLVPRPADRLRRNRMGRLAARGRARRQRARRDAVRVGRLAHEGQARGRASGRAERVDRALVLGAASRAPLLRARGRVRRHQRPLGAVRRSARRGDRHAGRAHRPRAARRRAGRALRPGRRASRPRPRSSRSR